MTSASSAFHSVKATTTGSFSVGIASAATGNSGNVTGTARAVRLVMVFMVAAWLGGEASVWLVSKASVGASGGLLGLLGFLLVFETLHRKLVPVSARRRLLVGVLATGVLGLVGFRFIDNAAHAGGLVAGMVYAAVVFPPSASPMRPRTLVRDRIFGALAGAVLVGSALFAGWMVAAG